MIKHGHWSTYFFLFIFLGTAQNSYAVAVLNIQQIKAQRQREAQEAQYQQYQSSQAQNQQAANTVLTYQQQIDNRNQAIAQAIINAHNQAVSLDNAQLKSSVNQAQSSFYSATTPQPASASLQQVLPSSSASAQEETVDLSEVWKKLDQKSTVWTILMDDQAKVLTVSEYINRFAQQGAKINAPPMHYVQMIDQLSQQNPGMLQMPFGQLIQILAIMDYDFNNGMDKDALARKVLGEQGYEANKQRFSQQQ